MLGVANMYGVKDVSFFKIVKYKDNKNHELDDYFMNYTQQVINICYKTYENGFAIDCGK